MLVEERVKMEELVLMALTAVSAMFELGCLIRLLHVSWKIEDLLTAAGLGVLTFEFILAKEADQQVALYLANIVLLLSAFYFYHRQNWQMLLFYGLSVALANLLLLQAFLKVGRGSLLLILVYAVLALAAEGWRRLNEKMHKQPDYLLNIYLLSSLLAWDFSLWLFGWSEASLLILLLLQACLALLVLLANQRDYERQLADQERENLRSYLQSVRKSEEELRRFKHDYQNMLRSLELSLKNDQASAALASLKKYSDDILEREELWQFKDVDRIADLQLQSLVIAKLQELRRRQICYVFEARQMIEVPAGIDVYDLIRIIGIAFDNAIEESISYQASGQVPAVEIMFYREQENSLEFTIKNKLRDQQKADLPVFSQANFTSKRGHAGLGLSNVQELQKKYANLFVEYRIEGDKFIFALTIA